MLISPRTGSPYRVAVPLANPANVRPLMTLACGLAGHHGGEVVAFCVLKDRVQAEFGGDRSLVAQAEQRLAMAVEAAHRWEVPVTTQVVVRRDTVSAIGDTARESGARVLVMGWRPRVPRRSGFSSEELDRIVEEVGCDVAILKPAARAGVFRRILIADLRGPDAALAGQVGAAVADRFAGEVHRLELAQPAPGGRGEPADLSIVRAESGDAGERAHVMLANSATEGILGAARGYDLVIVGTSRRGLSRQLLYGRRLDAIACRTNASLLVVRSANR